MRMEMNLASEPFGRSRLFWLASGFAAAGLLGVAVMLGMAVAGSRGIPPEMLETERRLQAQIQELAAEEAQLRADLGDPATVDIYDRSHFLNQLLTRKGVSWTRTFEDIEQVLPPRVLMMQIRPEVTYENDVQLEMQVGAETWDDFIEFVSSLEGSEKFGPPNVRGYSPPNENEPYFRFQLTVKYAQQL
jgi:Tfp pilus assembly protein PilN